MITLFALVVLVLFLVAGIPIPLTFLASSAVFVYFGGYNTMSLIPFGYSKMNSVVLLTIPLFILAGAIIDKGGLGVKLVGLVERFAGKIRGGIGIVTVVSCGIFGSISGSSSATVSCIGSIMAPRMRDNGYSAGFTGALIASAGVLGILIPPSMLMILYAWMGGQSVLASFLATLVPGLILIVLFSFVNLVICAKNPDIKPYSAPVEQTGGKRKWRLGNSAIPAIIMPVLILGSIYGGILTPTEAAALSVIYAVPVGYFIYKAVKIRELGGAFLSAGITTGVIMLMLFGVMILSRLFVMEDVHEKVLTLLTGITTNSILILLMINVFMVFVGMLMDDVSAVLLCTPLLLPVVMQLGINPIHFAAIMGVNLGMGNVTPPTAPLLFLSSRVTGANVSEMMPYTIKLLLFAWFPTLLLTTYFPPIATFIPSLFGYL